MCVNSTDDKILFNFMKFYSLIVVNGTGDYLLNLMNNTHINTFCVFFQLWLSGLHGFPDCIRNEILGVVKHGTP